MTKNREGKLWWLLRTMQKHKQWLVSLVLGLIFFVLGESVNTKGFTTPRQELWPSIAMSVLLGLSSSLISYFMQTMLELRKDLANDVQTAISRVIEQSVNVASPYLKLVFGSTAAHWLQLFAKAGEDKDPRICAAAGEVNRALRAISCRAFSMDVHKYADAAQILLREGGGAQRTVESITYYPNHGLIKLLGDTENTNQVRDWIQKVNQWAVRNPARKICRIHLFKADEIDKRSCLGKGKDGDVKCLHLQQAQQFINLLEANTNARDFYFNHYVKPNGLNSQLTFQALELPSSAGVHPILPPECILIDREVALMYDSDFCQLRIFFGEIAQQMGQIFENGDAKCIESNKMARYLKRKAPGG